MDDCTDEFEEVPPAKKPKKNPHPYDDEEFRAAVSNLRDVVMDVWMAGSSEDDLRQEFEQALETAMYNG